MLGKIKSIHQQSRKQYGSPKVYRQLRQDGESCNHKRVERLMRENQLKAKRVKKFKATTHSQHQQPIAENLLNREFSVSQADKVWVSDITYVWTDEGWLYLAIFIDLFSRMMVGWSMSERMTSELVLSAFEMGQQRRGGKVWPLVHSDRGSQYASAAFREQLSSYGCEQSMSRAAESYDNANAESLFSRYKAELLEGGAFRDVEEAQMESFDYIERYYNRVRRHSALGYVSPEEFERAYFQRTRNDLLINQERT